MFGHLSGYEASDNSDEAKDYQSNGGGNYGRLFAGVDVYGHDCDDLFSLLEGCNKVMKIRGCKASGVEYCTPGIASAE